MIIIKIIILYVIQIRHTDNFPSTGTRLVKDKAGKISSKDNYRHSTLASVIRKKLVQVIMLGIIEMYTGSSTYRRRLAA